MRRLARQVMLVAAVTAGCAHLGLLDAWGRDRSRALAAVVFGAVGLIFGLIAVGLSRKR